MSRGDTLPILLVVLGFLLSLPALWLVCTGLWPRAVKGAAARTSAGLYKPFLAGLPLTLVVLIVAAAAKNVAGPIGNIIAAGLASSYVLFASTGVAGLAQTIGSRLQPREGQPPEWQLVLRGGVALELTFLLPVLGWFVILPASLIIGCGAAAIGTFSRLVAGISDGEGVGNGQVRNGNAVTADLP